MAQNGPIEGEHFKHVSSVLLSNTVVYPEFSTEGDVNVRCSKISGEMYVKIREFGSIYIRQCYNIYLE